MKGRDIGVAGARGAALTFSPAPASTELCGRGATHVPLRGGRCSSGGAGGLPCDPPGSPARLGPPWQSRGAAASPCPGAAGVKQEPAGLPKRGLPRECSGPIPRIRRWVFVCCCAPEVWCYCDRKRGRRGEGGRPPAGDVPVKSLCPCRALSCEFPQRGESRLCAAAGLPTCESPGPGGVSRGAGAEGWQGPCLLLSPGRGPSQQCPMGAGLLRCPWAVGWMQQDVAGRKAPAPWPSRLGAVGGQSLCPEPGGLAALLRSSPP